MGIHDDYDKAQTIALNRDEVYDLRRFKQDPGSMFAGDLIAHDLALDMLRSDYGYSVADIGRAFEAGAWKNAESGLMKFYRALEKKKKAALKSGYLAAEYK